jgi:hypothetical protein
VINDLFDEGIERVDAAFNRVLAAEAAARESVAACREEAERLLDEADARARRIAEHADRRIGYIQGIAADHLRLALAELLSPGPEIPLDPTDGPTRQRLETAIAQLADEMVGVGMTLSAVDHEGGSR